MAIVTREQCILYLLRNPATDKCLPGLVHALKIRPVPGDPVCGPGFVCFVILSRRGVREAQVTTFVAEHCASEEGMPASQLVQRVA